MKPIRWGVLSTANIARLVIQSNRGSEVTRFTAVASRDAARAQRFAAEQGLEASFGSYEALLASDLVDAVYVALPVSMHTQWTLRALEAGKHVLCEKPIAITADEAAQLREVAGRVHVMEAFMVRFHLQWLRAREIVRSGLLGELRSVQGAFSYFNEDPANIRNLPDIGGGALLDIGCYPIVAGRFFFEAEPARVMALVDRDPRFGVDRSVSALADFGAGHQLSFSVSTQSVPFQRLQLFGSKKRLELRIPFNAPQGEPVQIFLDDGSRLADASAQAETLPPCDQYALQGDAFSKVIRGELALPYGVDDAVQNMRIIDAMFRSEKSGAWEGV